MNKITIEIDLEVVFRVLALVSLAGLFVCVLYDAGLLTKWGLL
ncbi:MAG: hypothetical protein ACRCUS_00985 [Anaerovoracaceae bacterium]